MQKYILLVAILASSYQCFHCFFFDGAQNDALVLLKANKDMDAKVIKMLSHTRSLYKVKFLLTRPNRTEQQWNFAVLAKGFLSDESRQTYISAIEDLKFVESHEVLDIHGESAIQIAYTNVAIKIAKVMGQFFGTLPKRPLKPQIPPYGKCSTVDIGENEEILLITAMKVGNVTSMKEYGKRIMYNILPALDVEMVYGGAPVSRHWDAFGIHNWGRRTTWCEYVLSEFAVKQYPLYLKAFADQVAYTAVEV